jgi:uncharacterized protein
MTDRRLDKGQLSRVQRTPQGGIRVDAALTRIGVLTYTNLDGTTRREFRSPEEVFHTDSLASLAGAPVLDGHSTWVTPETWQQHARGHVVEGSARQDGELVASQLTIQDAGTLSRVERRDLSEISCGYTCDFVARPGEWKGQRYDGIQTNIRYNHIALLGAGQGRAGRECALRLDAASAEQPNEATEVSTVCTVEQARLDMVDRNRSAWQTPAADNASDALELETPRQREDADPSFTLDDIRAASQAAARDAWKGGTPAAAAPAIAWKRTLGGTFMARV